jgi:predicted RNase H-like nuclease
MCCNLARSRLGERQSSVFSVPARAALAAQSYREACDINLSHSDPPRRIAKQTFNILARIQEIDVLMSPALQARVFECHPEVSFTIMNGERPLSLAKKVKGRPYTEGLALRRQLLQAAGLEPPPVPARFSSIRCGEDDLLDACACLFTARRIAAGEAIRLPSDPSLDAKGLRMEINA